MPDKRPATYIDTMIRNVPALFDSAVDRENPPNAIIEMFYPRQRLCPDELIVPYQDPPKRYWSVPKPVELPYSEIGWDLRIFLDSVLARSSAMYMAINPLLDLFTEMGRRFHRQLRESRPDIHARYQDYYNPAGFPHYAEMIESIALGGAFDDHYLRIGQSLRVFNRHIASSHPDLKKSSHLSKDSNKTGSVRSQLIDLIERYSTDYLAERSDNGSPDLDITFLSLDNNTFDPYAIQSSWDACRRRRLNDRPYRGLGTICGDPGIEGKNYQLVKRVQPDGDEIYEGWKIKESCADDGTRIFAFQIGTFKAAAPNGFMLSKEETLRPHRVEYLIEMTVKPRAWSDYDSDADRRSGEMVSFADDRIKLLVKSPELDSHSIVTEPILSWGLHKYSQLKYYLFWGIDLFEDKSRIIETITRGVKQMATKVGKFDVRDKFAERCEKIITPELWDNITSRDWSNDLLYTVLGAVHLSPIVLAANLIPDSRLDALPDAFKKKLAIHGIDYSLSLGNLWEVFADMTDEQIAIFLDAVPYQEKYLDTYFKSPYELENQGLYHIMTALKKAGVEMPDFSGNPLLQAAYIFRHPDDRQPLALAHLDNIRRFVISISGNEPSGFILPTLVQLRDELLEYGYIGINNSEIAKLLNQLISIYQKEDNNEVKGTIQFRSADTLPDTLISLN